MQDRCMVCVKCTIGPQIILDSSMELLGDMGHVESHFFLFGDSVNVGAKSDKQVNICHFAVCCDRMWPSTQ